MEWCVRKAVGIDIGGTKIGVAAVTGEGRLAEVVTLPTESCKGFGDGLDRMGAAVRQVMAKAGWRLEDVAGIGIGCAVLVDPVQGIIQNPYTLPGWDDARVVEALTERLSVRVVLENDADAALVGECRFGAGRGFDPVVMLTLGTGVGGAVWANGGIARGSRGQHPELGHLLVSNDGPGCYCGANGCLESIASGTAIGEAGRPEGYADAREVFAAAREGAPRAQAILERVSKALGAAIWTLAHTIVPARIVLGGGIMDEHFDWFEPALSRAVAGATQFDPRTLDFARAALGNQAGLVGAASLVLATCDDVDSRMS